MNVDSTIDVPFAESANQHGSLSSASSVTFVSVVLRELSGERNSRIRSEETGLGHLLQLPNDVAHRLGDGGRVNAHVAVQVNSEAEEEQAPSCVVEEQPSHLAQFHFLLERVVARALREQRHMFDGCLDPVFRWEALADVVALVAAAVEVILGV